MSLLGKFFVTVAIPVAGIATAEIYPTRCSLTGLHCTLLSCPSIRCTVLGLCAASGRLGAVLSTFLSHMYLEVCLLYIL